MPPGSRADGLRVLCVTPMYPEPAHPAFGVFVRALNDELGRLGITVDVVRRPVGRRGALSYAQLAGALAGRTARRYDVIHGHYLGPAAMMALAFARARRTPCVLTAHGSDIEAGRRAWIRPTLRLLVATADGVHFVSNALAIRARELLGVEARQVLVQPIGIDPERFAFRPPPPPASAPRLLMVARLSPEKGWEEALAALASLVRRGIDARLVACGDGQRAWLERTATRLGIRGRLDLLGFRRPDELPNLYGSADVVLIPSHREGFGLVGLEAMAAGVPVVSTGAGGLAEYMRDGDNALLVPSRDPEALATAVARVLVDEALRHRLAARGRATVERYTLRRAAEALTGFYEKVRDRAR